MPSSGNYNQLDTNDTLDPALQLHTYPTKQNPTTRTQPSQASSNSTDRVRNSSDSTTPIQPAPLKTNAAQKSKNKLGYWDAFQRRISDTWLVEIANLLCSVLALAALTALLLVYNEKPLNGWQNTVGLNTVVSGLATVFTYTLMEAMGEAIGQMRWVRFAKRGGTLEEFEAFDEATRGPWGGIWLLVRGRGGVTTSFGVVVGLIALLVGPFVQEVISVDVKNVPLDSGVAFAQQGLMVYNGIIQNRILTTDNGVNVDPLVSFPFEAAAINALYGGITVGVVSNKLATCSTGNCTWSPFNTMAVCGHCNNVTDQVQYNTNNESYSVNGAILGSQDTRTGQWNSTVNQTIDASTGNGSLIHFTAMQSSSNDTTLDPQALECFLSYCIQTIQANVTNGVLTETILSNQTEWKSSVDLNTIFQNSGDNLPPNTPAPFINSSSPINDTNTPFMISLATMGAQRSWLTTLFTMQVYLDEEEDLTYQSTQGTDCQTCEALYSVDLVDITDLPTTINSIAQSLTEQMRLPQKKTYLNTADEYNFNITTTVAGVAHHDIIINTVQWKWLILPIAVEVSGILFVVAVIVASERAKARLWKTSSLPVLFHGLEGPERREAVGATGMWEMKELAERVAVRLGVSDAEGGLMLIRRA